ncbi:L-aspartate oxidase [Pseudoxanthomonas wuyuanensis]|uniref:L-aspartate oxidase n=1 Tax=Pseudoxanthomonas wuyuanensis TaxID=1073196 RepID=A0A286CZ41_9GAMM|nr:FAD-binding protein [Pseudoxanthomonas wuyuanensis]KAF1722280.1 FAD-binding protein [Pseudoxanthomonas wuyuanensis]SOD51670.1 L-aspartate oxidase [Pseudoxanthomonas wuyuanensis]
MTGAQLPVIVVGCGVAGLATALAAAPRPVLLIGRQTVGQDCASALAQGGIAAAMGHGDSPAEHARDTLAAGAGHNRPDAVRYLVDHAVVAVRWLQTLGVEFDRDGDKLALGREGGHHLHRILHAGGDASGAALLAALHRAALRAAHIQWQPPCDVDALLLRDQCVAGVRVRDRDGRENALECSEAVLATGGIGALFAATTNPAGADGSGLALAMAAGAPALDLEFMQFHPTALAVAGNGALPLITEALRGAGAVLCDDDGARIMAGRHPLADLAPRDLVARQVWQVLQAGGRAWLDATAVTGDWQRRFPTVDAICRRHGIDPRTQRIPVTPAAHFHMGGIAVDFDGRTAIRGLHAVGETACNGVHGANRLASNSLLEGIVYGRRLGRLLADVRLSACRSGSHRLVERGQSATDSALAELRALSWRALGPVRDGATMRQALAHIHHDAALHSSWQGKLVTRMLEAALLRRRSLGAHYRQDAEKRQSVQSVPLRSLQG